MEKNPPLVFHADWFYIIEELPQEQQLEVYRAIMLFAFRGEISDNPIARATTALMRKFIDADRNKYADICKKRKEAISRRWKAQKNTTDTSEYKSIQVNTSDTNTNTNTINQDQDQDQDQDTTAKAVGVIDNRAGARAAYDDSVLLSEFFAPERQGSLEVLQMQLHLTLDEIKHMAQEIVNEWTLTGQTHTDYTDASRHLISTLRKKKQWGKPSDSQQPSDPGLGIGEFRNSRGQRTYAQSGVIVPDNAPPRPSAAHWWSETSRQWEKQI